MEGISYLVALILYSIETITCIKVIVDVTRTTLTADSASPAFNHALDTFSNPFGDSRYCHSLNAHCYSDGFIGNGCNDCACAMDDTFFSIKHGCLNRTQVKTIIHGNRCLEYLQQPTIIPTATENTFKNLACQEIFIPFSMQRNMKNCYEESLWKNNLITGDIQLYSDQTFPILKITQNSVRMCVTCQNFNCDLSALSGAIIKLDINCFKTKLVKTCFLFKMDGTQYLSIRKGTLPPPSTTTTIVTSTTQTTTPTTTKTPKTTTSPTTKNPKTTTSTTTTTSKTSTSTTSTTQSTTLKTTSTTSSKNVSSPTLRMTTPTHVITETTTTKATTKPVKSTIGSKSEYKLVTISRSPTIADSFSPGFYHAKDVFTNPYQDPNYCIQHNARCVKKNNHALNVCEACACAVDETFFSMKHGCLKSNEIRALINGTECLEHHQLANETIPTAIHTTFQHNDCRQLFLPDHLKQDFQNCHSGSIWKNSLLTGEMKLYMNQNNGQVLLRISQDSIKLCVTCQDYYCKMSPLSGHIFKLNINCLRKYQGKYSDSKTCFLSKITGKTSILVDSSLVKPTKKATTNIKTTIRTTNQGNGINTTEKMREEVEAVNKSDHNKSDSNGLVIGLSLTTAVLFVCALVGWVCFKRKKGTIRSTDPQVRYYPTNKTDSLNPYVQENQYKNESIPGRNSQNCYYQSHDTINLHKENEIYESTIENEYMDPDVLQTKLKENDYSCPSEHGQHHYNDVKYAFQPAVYTKVVQEITRKS